jgi:hypothetical protein
VCDSLTMVLTGFLLVVVSKSLGLLAIFQAIAFGCSVAAVLWNWQVLCSRAAELRLNKAVLLLAGLPFYQAAKALVLLAPLPTGGDSCAGRLQWDHAPWPVALGWSVCGLILLYTNMQAAYCSTSSMFHDCRASPQFTA